MLSSLTGALDRRFLLNAVLPSALFILSTAFVWLAGAGIRPGRRSSGAGAAASTWWSWSRSPACSRC